MLGGPGAGLSDPVRMDPVKMGLRAVANGQRTLRAGFTTVRNLGLFIKTGGYLVDVALADAIAAGWVEGPRVIPAGHAICPTGGHLDPSAQSGLAPGHHADDRRGGHRRRDRRGPQGRPLPDHPRRQAHQVLRLGRRDDPDRSAGRAAVLHRGARRDRRRGTPPRPPGRHPLPRRHGRQRRARRRHRLHRARDDDRRRHDPAAGRHRHLPRLDVRPHRELGHLRPAQVAPGQGGRGLPQGQGVADRRRSRPA